MRQIDRQTDGETETDRQNRERQIVTERKREGATEIGKEETE